MSCSVLYNVHLYINRVVSKLLIHVSQIKLWENRIFIELILSREKKIRCNVNIGFEYLQIKESPISNNLHSQLIDIGNEN